MMPFENEWLNYWLVMGVTAFTWAFNAQLDNPKRGVGEAVMRAIGAGIGSPIFVPLGVLLLVVIVPCYSTLRRNRVMANVKRLIDFKKGM